MKCEMCNFGMTPHYSKTIYNKVDRKYYCKHCGMMYTTRESIIQIDDTKEKKMSCDKKTLRQDHGESITPTPKVNTVTNCVLCEFTDLCKYKDDFNNLQQHANDFNSHNPDIFVVDSVSCKKFIKKDSIIPPNGIYILDVSLMPEYVYYGYIPKHCEVLFLDDDFVGVRYINSNVKISYSELNFDFDWVNNGTIVVKQDECIVVNDNNKTVYFMERINI